MKDPRTEPFLRSINLAYDVDHPERIEHFRPTSKTLDLIRAICGRRAESAFMVTAAYGSGKSIAATTAAQAVVAHPDARKVLRSVAVRMKNVDGDLADYFAERDHTRIPKGMAVVLEGYCPDLDQSLRGAIVAAEKRSGLRGRGRHPNVKSRSAQIAKLFENAIANKIDTIAIVWDEFGRHLEGLVNSGHSNELSVLQNLAEMVSRIERPKVTLTLLLHQGLFQYAGSLSQSLRNEWKKIEGRFTPIQYVEDSRGIYRMLAEIVEKERADGPSQAVSHQCVEAAKTAMDYGMFNAFERPSDLADTLERAFPIDPSTLYLLPRLSARVAQNERTIFSFLKGADLERPVTLSDLYDYFAPSMRSDTGLGGTFRQWLETERALTKTRSEAEEHLIKSAALLGLGLYGQRARVNPDMLAFAAAGHLGNKSEFVRATEALIGRNLLLHRRHNNDVSVWHGTDVDLRGRLDDEKLRVTGSFDLLSFLGAEYPPLYWFPLIHNTVNHIKRYYAGRYADAEGLLRKGAEHPIWRVKGSEDGIIVYAIPRSAEERQALERLARDLPNDPRLVLAIPRKPISVMDTALEIWALSQLQKDPALVGEDPMVLPELQQMTDDARQHLNRLMDRVLIPSPSGPLWYAAGEPLGVESRGQLRYVLSELMNRRFPDTPRINSEAIVRNRMTRPMMNARKKLLIGILERSGQADLGFEGTTPDTSIYRTVIASTGLYRKADDVWGWARADELSDRGLRAVWNLLHEFITQPSSHPKSLAELLSGLSNPPYGVRQGLLVILVAAGLKAFPSSITILRDGEYLPDLLPTDIEDICTYPARYSVNVYPMEASVREYVEGFAALFSEEARGPAEADLIRGCFDAIEGWKRRIPASALTTAPLNEGASEFRRLIRSITDPAKLLFAQVPILCGEHGNPSPTILEKVEKWRDEIASLSLRYEKQAIAIIEEALFLDRGQRKDGLHGITSFWGGCIPDSALERVDHVAKAVVRAVRQAVNGRHTEHSLAGAFSAILVGKEFGQWTHATANEFRLALRNAVTAIEEAAISSSCLTSAVPLVERRLRYALNTLEGLVGKYEARSILEKINNVGGRDHHADSA